MSTCRKIEKKKEPTFRTEKVGTIEIDTGMLVISDPCRLDEVVESVDRLTGGPPELWGTTGEFIGEKSKRSFAVMSMTGIGDGRYPVYAEIVDDPEWGERVIALHIHMGFGYSLCDDPEVREELKKDEEEYLAHMNS